jgi:formylglycine-generating enzyme required for sulfatase activity
VLHEPAWLLPGPLWVEREADHARHAGVLAIERVDVEDRVAESNPVTRFDTSNTSPQRHQNGTKPPVTPESAAQDDAIVPARGDEPTGAEEVAAAREFTERPLVGADEITRIIHRDLSALPSAEREYYRYFTYANLRNERLPSEAGPEAEHLWERQTDEAIATTRQALAKALNSLSWAPSLVLPHRVDADGIVERVDLRGLIRSDRTSHWTNEQWDRICSRYPYGRLSGSRVEAAVLEWTGTSLPAVRADWFATAATRWPLYGSLLGLPGRDGTPGADAALERMLRVEVAGNIRRGERMVRCGVGESASGFSPHHRVLERHALADGAYYWKSYDFAELGGRGDIALYPFGPSTIEGLPEGERALAFEHAGSEILFSLPNGLQGYMVVTPEGISRESVPSEIVLKEGDEGAPNGPLRVGGSCIACHASGIRVQADQMRELARKAVPAELQPRVAALFGSVGAAERLQRADRARFVEALGRLGISAECDSPDCEPIGRVAARFDEHVKMERAIAELGIRRSTLLLELDALGPSVFARLESDGYSRLEFQTIFADLIYSRPALGAPTGCGGALERVAVEPSVVETRGDSSWRQLPESWNANWDAEIIAYEPDPLVLKDEAGRERVLATRLPWKVRDRKTGIVFLLCPRGEFSEYSFLAVGDRWNREAADAGGTLSVTRIPESFYLSETELTQAQWLTLMDENPSHFTGMSLPVEQISWGDAQEFCERSGLRLPKRSEWLYAFTGGMSPKPPTDLTELGWYLQNSGEVTQPVATRQRNAWGFHDMRGNVREWVTESSGGAALLGSCFGDSTGRIVPELVLDFQRHFLQSWDVRFRYYGVRLARTPG